jgi:hypothetical protein
MKKQILLSVGLALMLFSTPEVKGQIGRQQQ